MKRFCNIRDLPVSGKESDRVSVFRGGTDCGEKSHVTSAWNAASIAVTQAGLQPQVVTQDVTQVVTQVVIQVVIQVVVQVAIQVVIQVVTSFNTSCNTN